MLIHADCRHYIGDRPCRFNRLCEGCEHFDKPSFKVLIIKLGAAGDVLRTTPLLRALRARHPGLHATWLTDATAFELLLPVGEIDRLLPFGFEGLARVRAERFDAVYCFDKEAHASALAGEVHSSRRVGFGFSSDGGPCPLNPESDYLFSLGLSDELKFHVNRKTYQQLIFEAAGLEFAGEEYLLGVPPAIQETVEAELRSLGTSGDRLRLGVNTGAGPVFANKAWSPSRMLEFVTLASRETGADLLLLGGPDEEERNRALAAASPVPLIDTGCRNPLLRFAAIVNACDVVVAGDTMAMHLGIGLKRPVIALFGSTCAQEVELYGRGEKIVTSLDCAPCYRRRCDVRPNCMDGIEPRAVVDAVKRWLPA